MAPSGPTKYVRGFTKANWIVARETYYDASARIDVQCTECGTVRSVGLSNFASRNTRCFTCFPIDNSYRTRRHEPCVLCGDHYTEFANDHWTCATCVDLLGETKLQTMIEHLHQIFRNLSRTGELE